MTASARKTVLGAIVVPRSVHLASEIAFETHDGMACSDASPVQRVCNGFQQTRRQLASTG
jgi:hypothetical protein